MSRREDAVELRQMLDHACEAVAMLGDLSLEALQANRTLNLALVRLLEIIGEAANRISSPEQARLAAIPWAQVIAMRNRLIHGYDAVDLRIVRDVILHDLPGMISQLERVLASR